MELFTRCFNEAIRMQPPIYFSTAHFMKQEVTINGFTFRKGDTFKIGIVHHCNAPSEWIEPTKFMPERWDPNSPLSLTPSGQKRNSYAFAPYTGGHRICVGMSVAQNISKTILPSILHQFKFKTIGDPDFKMPYNNFYQRFNHVFNVEASPRRA